MNYKFKLYLKIKQKKLTNVKNLFYYTILNENTLILLFKSFFLKTISIKLAIYTSSVIFKTF